MRKLLVAVTMMIAMNSAGCARAWVIREGRDGGTIGYKSFFSPEKAAKAVEKLIPCRPYTELADRLESKQEAYTTYQTVSNETTGTLNGRSISSGSYNYTATTTSQVPVTNYVTSYWHEVDYSCIRPTSSSDAAPLN